MAERDTQPEHEQADTVTSSPTSSHAATNGPKATKDRSCPFCGQAFTSSSLGRHLDLYIKPKNPKAPDGVHDVDDIRKMRGGITRRQPRTSLKTSLHDDESGRKGSADGTPMSSASNKPTFRVHSRFSNGSAAVSPGNLKEHDMLQMAFNPPNWQATGVINNIPHNAPSRSDGGTPTDQTGQAQRVQDLRLDAAGNRVQRPDYEAEGMWKLQEAAEVGRAAELALREVLGSLEAARKKIEPKELFDGVDFFSLSFPGLCLAILSPPATLFSPTPYNCTDSWSLTAPGQKQFEALNIKMNRQFTERRQGVRERFPDSDAFKHAAHVQSAYDHWQLLSEADRASAWTLDVLRAYARASEQSSKLRRDLEASQSRIRHLEADFDRLSRYQLPREYLLRPPDTMPVPAAIVKEMAKSQQQPGALEMEYDADALLSKWRTTVKATRRKPAAMCKPAAIAPSTQSASSPIHAEPNINPLKGDMFLNGAVFGVNGAMPRNTGASVHDASSKDSVNHEETASGALIRIADADADADGEADDDAGNFGGHVGAGTSARQMQSAFSEVQALRRSPKVRNGVLNANGKRPLAPTLTNGRGQTKIYKEKHDV